MCFPVNMHTHDENGGWKGLHGQGEVRKGRRNVFVGGLREGLSDFWKTKVDGGFISHR